MDINQPFGVIGNGLELNRRELQVLHLLAWGKTNAQMAKCLKISPRTVEIHRAHMIRKLGANSSSEAVRIGIMGGLPIWRQPAQV